MTAQEKRETRKVATFYNAGRLQDYATTPNVFMFTCWNERMTGCGCHSVYHPELDENIKALRDIGYRVFDMDEECDRNEFAAHRAALTRSRQS